MTALDPIDLLSLQSRLRIERNATGPATVFDPVRRAVVRLTPEELVRQLWIQYLLHECAVPRHRMAIERGFGLSGQFRFDLMVVDQALRPLMLAEFKSPGTPINQAVFDQVSVYNLSLEVPYALISNGLSHYCFRFDADTRSFAFQRALPLP